MKPARKDTLATRRRLIDAAEELFAERGLDNVSLVDIARAAGQKNRNALQYHFGDKVSLIHAVLDKHSEGIAAQRSEMLDALEAEGSVPIRHLVEALVLPVAAKLEDEEGGRAFLKINSQLMVAEGYAHLRMDRMKLIPEARRLEKLMAAELKGRDAAWIAARVLLVDCMLFHGLATYLSRGAKLDRATFVRALVDGVTAVLT